MWKEDTRRIYPSRILIRQSRAFSEASISLIEIDNYISLIFLQSSNRIKNISNPLFIVFYKIRNNFDNLTWYSFSLLNIQIFVFTKNFIIFLFSWEVTTSSNILNFSANTNRATIPRQKMWKVSILICSDANYRAFTRAIGSDPSKKKVHTEATRATLEPVRRVTRVFAR